MKKRDQGTWLYFKLKNVPFNIMSNEGKIYLPRTSFLTFNLDFLTKGIGKEALWRIFQMQTYFTSQMLLMGML